MNLRHAAALALVGWYLLMPPMPVEPSGLLGPPDLRAPLSKWDQEGEYDHVGDCQSEIFQIRNYSLDSKIKPKNRGAANAALAILNARCIATDDPRLKETK